MDIPWVVTLWEDVNFRGRRRTICQNEPNLDRLAFNDVVSSVEIKYGSVAPGHNFPNANHSYIRLFQHSNYRGRFITLKAGKKYNSIHGMNNFGDILSSVQFNVAPTIQEKPLVDALDIFPRADEFGGVPLVVTVYTGTHYTGKKADILENIDDIGAYLGLDFNDAIRSLTVCSGPDYQPGNNARFYLANGFNGGPPLQLGLGDYPDIPHGFYGISSIKVR